MNKTHLQNYIQSVISMPPDKAEALMDAFEACTFNKNENLFIENKVPKFSYILEEGFVRSFTHDSEGNEVTTNIFAPFCLVNDLLAFFKQQPASEYIQTLTTCHLWKINYEQLQANYHGIPEFREFGRMMLVHNYTQLKTRMLGMIKDTAEQRYLKLLEQQPDIFQHVPLKMIASFLGVTDTSLSRIRKDVAGRH